MESFVPSTTGEGQGGAQILSADFTPLNASGIVRGIERASLSLAKQREQQYEKELEAQKKKAAQNKLLQDAQNKTNIKELDIAKDLIYQEYINKAKSDPNFDIEVNFPTLIRDLESVNSLDEGVSGLSKTLSSGSNKISSYIGGEYVDNTVPILQSVMSGTLYESDEERIKAIQDGTYTQDINARISQAFSDPNVVMNTDKGVKSAYDELISKAQEQKTISQEGTTLDGKPIIRETKKVITNKQIKDELMNNPTLKTVERNKYAKENNISPLEVDEHLKENGYDDGFIGYYTGLVNSQFPDDFEFTEKVGSKTKEGGGKGITEQDLTIAKQVKEAVNILQDNPSSKESREGLNTFLAPYNVIVKSYGDSTPIEIKDLGLSDGDIIFVDNDGKAKSAPLKANDADGIYRVIAKAAPDVKLEALGQIELKDPTPQGDVPEISAEEKTQLDSAFKELNKDGLTKAPKYLDDLGVKLEGNWSDGYVLVIGDKKYRADDKEQAKQAYIEAQKLVGNKKYSDEREAQSPKEVETTIETTVTPR